MYLQYPHYKVLYISFCSYIFVLVLFLSTYECLHFSTCESQVLCTCIYIHADPVIFSLELSFLSNENIRG